MDKSIEITLSVSFKDNTSIKVKLGDLKLLSEMKKEEMKFDVVHPSQNPLVVVCMATYNPNLKLFKQQIESLINQSYGNWICIINDDCSNYSDFKEMKEIINSDSRFMIRRNEINLGFYANFQECLSLVPVNADFIAMCDQDDYWHRNKLETCINNFDSETMLVYSDMNLVKENGELISNTYWTNRRNNYDDYEFLMLANTITGAASIFKRELMEFILPFPHKVGDSYHDWWIALCALSIGKIKYINEPLYDYYQHSSNVIGHSDKKKINRKFKLSLSSAKRFFKRSLSVYEYDYKRLVLCSNVIKTRIINNENESGNRKFLKPSVLMMANLYVKGKILRRDTLYAENRLLLSVISRNLAKILYKVNSSKHEKNALSGATNSIQPHVEQSSIANYESLYHKISPLKLNLDSSELERINILIPTIDFKYFFGGYIGKFNLARKLSESGGNVRFVIVDYCDFNLENFKVEISKYKNIGEIFNDVEVEYMFNREKELNVHPNDLIIATTWWTAYIAKNMVDELNAEKFTYLIQEYEPLTFPHGGFYALANETYNFKHNAIFSTELLREFFKLNNIGVFKDSGIEGDSNSVSFENAIQSFSPDKELMINKKKKLLFYSRLESHASRNMFEVGILALMNLIKIKKNELKNWEFYGMGSVGNYKKIKLDEDTYLNLLPKMNLEEYAEALPKFDVGLSLMYTPHPSLVPLEMASAGMFVVTNSFENKNKEKLKEISGNFIVAEPNVNSVVNSLIKAIEGVDNVEKRIEGSTINWSTDWDNTFNEEKLEKIKGLIKNNKYEVTSV